MNEQTNKHHTHAQYIHKSISCELVIYVLACLLACSLACVSVCGCTLWCVQCKAILWMGILFDRICWSISFDSIVWCVYWYKVELIDLGCIQYVYKSQKMRIYAEKAWIDEFQITESHTKILNRNLMFIREPAFKTRTAEETITKSLNLNFWVS